MSLPENKMNRLTTVLSILIMMLSFSSSAQKEQATPLQWKMAGELPAINGQRSLGLAGPVTGVHHSMLLVGGGANFPNGMPWEGGVKKYYDEVYAFKIDTDTAVYTGKVFRLPFPLAYSANCSTSHGIVCAGGENAEGSSKKVLLLQWNEKSKNLLVNDLPDLPFAVTNAVATSVGDYVYLAGGETSSGVSNQLLALDLNHVKAGWKQLPSLPKPVSHAVMVAQSNGRYDCLYVIGGRKKSKEDLSEFYSSVYEFDLKANQWKEKKPLPYGISAGTGIAAGKEGILLLGGDKGERFHKTEALVLAIANEKDSTKKQQLIRQKTDLQASHPGFSREVLLYNTVTNNWTVVDSMPFDTPVTTSAIRWKSYVILPNGEIRAGVRTPEIVTGKLCVK